MPCMAAMAHNISKLNMEIFLTVDVTIKKLSWVSNGFVLFIFLPYL